MLDDEKDKPRIPVRKGDKWLVLILGIVAIAAFFALGLRFSDTQEWGDDATMQKMVKLLESMGVIFVLGITLAFFKSKKLEQVLFRKFLGLLLILAGIILTLIFCR